MYLAHVYYDNSGKKHEQTLSEHIRAVASYAAAKLCSVKLSSVGYLCGLLHDMGKATKKFKEYLEKASLDDKEAVRGSVVHSTTACIWVLERYRNKGDKFYDALSELVAYTVGAHHGLFDCINPDMNSGFSIKLTVDRDDLCYEEAEKNFFAECATEEEVDELFYSAVEEIKAYQEAFKRSAYYCGLTARLILSAVIDGDRRDTAEFMNEEKIPILPDDMRLIWFDLLRSEEDKLSELQKRAVDSVINRERKKISDCCFAFAERDSGIYGLSVPTGGGKTLASLRYALRHAYLKNKKRIFYVAPLLTVLDQNAKTIREYVNEDSKVLEHSSDVIRADMGDEEVSQYDMLTDSWDSPIIITTLVQLLNTLFAGKTSCVRRMNALSDSVIVLDEMQSLPLKLTNMTNEALNFLSLYCGATVVACTATQPYSDKMKHPLRVTDNMVSEADIDSKVFERVNVYDRREDRAYSVDKLADLIIDEMSKKDSLLFICNTKTLSTELYHAVKSRNSAHNASFLLYSMSAAMCKKHREATLTKINAALGKERIVCIATQVVEAGVDFSFECVVRAIGGIDNIAQAAGRCNRNREYPYLCDVYIVNPEEKIGYPLKEISYAQNAAIDVLCNVEKGRLKGILSAETIKAYYDKLFVCPEVNAILDYTIQKFDCKMMGLLSKNERFRLKSRSNLFLNQAFKTAGETFSVFDQNTIEIIVQYDDVAKELVNELCSERAKYDKGFVKELLCKAKPYTISGYAYQKAKLGLFCPENVPCYILQDGFYDEEIGLCNAETIL